jgi:predicted nucleotidyltransferase
MEPIEPAALPDRLAAFTATDERILAVLVFGSHATGTFDAYSDVDIGLVVSDAGYDAVIANRDELIRALGEPLLAEDFGTASTVHVITADGIAFELIIGRAGELDLARPYRVVVDRAGVVEGASGTAGDAAPEVGRDEFARRLVTWFWHDLEHVITALGRDQLLWAHGGLEEMRGVCIGLARVLANADLEPDDPYWKVDGLLSPELAARLRGSVAQVERAALLAATRELVELYRELAAPVARSAGIAYPADLDRLLADRLRHLA